MNIPKRYEDLTVNQFQQLEELKSNDTLDKLDKAILRLSILSGESIDTIEGLSPKKVYDLLLDAVFLTMPVTSMAMPEEFMLGKIKFKYIKELSQYNIAQQKDWTSILESNGANYIKCLPELMAICHLEKVNDEWVYNSNNHQRNVELFGQSKLKDSLGAVFFYSNCLKSYSEIIADCLADANKTIQEMNEMMLADSEFQTFLNGGDGSIQ